MKLRPCPLPRVVASQKQFSLSSCSHALSTMVPPAVGIAQMHEVGCPSAPSQPGSVHGAQFSGLGLWRGLRGLIGHGALIGHGRLIGGGCRILVASFASQFVGGLGYLRFQIFHRSRDIEIAAADVAAEVEIERFFQFPGHVAVESSRVRRWFLRHAFATLY